MPYNLCTYTVPINISHRVRELISKSVSAVHTVLGLDPDEQNACYMLEDMIGYYGENEQYVDSLCLLEYYLSTIGKDRDKYADIPTILQVYSALHRFKGLILELGSLVEKSALIYCGESLQQLLRHLIDLFNGERISQESVHELWTVLKQHTVTLADLKSSDVDVKGCTVLMMTGKYAYREGQIVRWNGTVSIVRGILGDMSVSNGSSVVLLSNIYRRKPNDSTNTVQLLTPDEKEKYESMGYYCTPKDDGAVYAAYGPIVYLRKSGLNLKGSEVLIMEGSYANKSAVIRNFNGTTVNINLYINGKKTRASIGRNKTIAVLKS